MRQLILVPILHSEQDMGSLSDQVNQAYVQTLGLLKWQRHSTAIQGLWMSIAQLLEQLTDALPLSADNIRLYQDGLPLCGHEAEIVSELAAKGSPNHRLLLALMTKGAKLMGTESAELLVQEYNLQKARLANLSATAQAQSQSDLDEQTGLLVQRDKYVAARINNSLGTNELGILFMGSAHSVHTWLSPDIRLTNLLPSLCNTDMQGGGASLPGKR